MLEKIKQSKVLVIDDEELNVEILSELFDIHEFENISGETDPVAAVELYKEQDFDLVLLDINMPVMDGFDVLRAFREINKEMPPPVLVLTALIDNNTRIKALSNGASDFLTKPFNQEEVFCRVNNLLEVHLSRKQLNNINHELEEKVQQRTKELMQSQQEALQSLAYAAEFRDKDTALHTVRVGWYSRLLGEKVGIQGDELDMLFQAAPMHDIGKIGIPDEILLKPGKFTPEEWEIMQSHSKIGGEILGRHSSLMMKKAQEIALYHHEKWDGTGYPHNLSGTGIPINARIVIVADVFDALTIDRPYKSAWEIDKAVEYIKEGAGTFFDPDLVMAFSEIIPDFLRIKEAFKD